MTRRFFRYVIPSIISMWVFSLYTMVDGIFVAKGVGDMALAAVNLSMPFVNAIFAIGLLFAAGTSTVISIALGENDHEKANRYFNQNLLVVSVLCLAISAVTLFNLDGLARFLGANEHTLQYVKDYIGTIAPFVIFFVVAYNMEVLVKADGTPIVSTVGVMTCALMNVVLDYVFVMQFHWGVKGAAFATGLAQLTSSLIFIAYFLFKGKKLHFGRFKRELSVYKRVIPLGLADGMSDMSNAIVIFAFNRVILQFIGESALVTYTVISYVTTLVLMTMMGTTQGIQPLVSFYYGAKDKKSYHKLLRYGVTAIGVFSVLAFAIAQLATNQIVGLFIDSVKSAELFAYSVNAMKIFSFSFLILGFNVIASGFFTAIERPKYSLTISLGRGLVLLLICLITGALVFGETGIWLATLAAELMCLVPTALFGIKYYKQQKLIAAEEN